MARPITCKKCGESFLRRGNTSCPKCGAKLPRVRHLEKRVVESTVPLEEPAVKEDDGWPEWIKRSATPEKPSAVLPPGVQEWETKDPLYPAKIRFDPRGGSGGNGRYTVDFSGYGFTPTFVFCPAPRCGKKLFQNMDLRGSCEHRCRICKALILFKF